MMITVLFLYTLALFVIALKSYRNVTDYNDFFVARRKGAFFTISGSLLATILGGSAIIGAVDIGPKMGWATAWFMICASAGLFALLPLVKKVKSLGRFTLPELLEDLYGKQVKQISAVIIPVAWLGIVAAQIIAGGEIVQSFTGLSYETGAIVSGLVFILYTVVGGQFSVLKTDLFQAVLIIIGLIMISFFAYQSACSPAGCLQAKASHPLSFPFNAHFKPFDLFILVLTYSTTFTAGPDIFSRIFSAKNEIIARRAVMTTAFLLLPIALSIAFLSAYGAACIPLPHKGSILMEICKTILPSWAVPLIVIMLLSVVLSSADTTLLSASIILTDMIEKGNFGDKSVKRTRIILLIFGLASILIALNFTSIIGILLIALTVYSGAFFLPIIAGLNGYQVKRSYLSAAIIAGGAIALTGKMISLHVSNNWGNIVITVAFLLNGLLILRGIKEQRVWRGFLNGQVH
jgi:SSS family solute:Na+ symporter